MCVLQLPFIIHMKTDNRICETGLHSFNYCIDLDLQKRLLGGNMDNEDVDVLWITAGFLLFVGFVIVAFVGGLL